MLSIKNVGEFTRMPNKIPVKIHIVVTHDHSFDWKRVVTFLALTRSSSSVLEPPRLRSRTVWVTWWVPPSSRLDRTVTMLAYAPSRGCNRHHEDGFFHTSYELIHSTMMLWQKWESLLNWPLHVCVVSKTHNIQTSHWPKCHVHYDMTSSLLTGSDFLQVVILRDSENAFWQD